MVFLGMVCGHHKRAQAVKNNNQVANTTPPPTQTSPPTGAATPTTVTSATMAPNSTTSTSSVSSSTGRQATSTVTTDSRNTQPGGTCPPYNSLPPLALPEGPPPSYDSVIALVRQQEADNTLSLSTAPHGLSSADIYGVPERATYQEPK